MENQNTSLPSLPDVKYYKPGGMKNDKRTKFMQWYEDEILKYCRSDVDILQKTCLTFRKMFMDVTCKDELQGIDPFGSCITIASACNLVFRRNVLDNESIGIIPANGYTPEHRQSIKALKWLKYVSERYQFNILHSRKGGEKQIGPYKVDGYRETETGDRTVYKFHGCFRHGCQKFFSRSTTNPITNSTMEDLHQGTLDKKQYLENLGYRYVSIRECDYEREIQSNGSMRSFVDSHCIIDTLEPRNAFYGGRTEACITFKEANGNKIDYYDVTSLYPFVNKAGKIPLGHLRIITENFEGIKSYEGLIKCKVIPPRGLFLPVLPTKSYRQSVMGNCCLACAAHAWKTAQVINVCLILGKERSLEHGLLMK
jgi:ribosomal protein S18